MPEEPITREQVISVLNGLHAANPDTPGEAVAVISAITHGPLFLRTPLASLLAVLTPADVLDFAQSKADAV